MVEFFCPGKERGISAFANVGDNLGGHGLGFSILPGTARMQPLFDSRREFDDAHQSTILFKGYSTIPWALAAFSFGKICRTTASSTMVVDRDPIGIAQRGNRRLLERGKNSENRLQVVAVDVEEQTKPCSPRRLRPVASE